MKKILLLTLVAVIAIFACTDTTSSNRYTQNTYYVVTGNLYEGQTVSLENAIWVGRSISVNNGNPLDMVVNNALVKIFDFENNEYALTFGAEFEEDGDIKSIGYYDESQQLIIEAGKKYKLEVVVPNSQNEAVMDTIRAETTVPDKAELVSNDAFTTNIDDIMNVSLDYDKAGSEYPIKFKVENEDPKYMYYKFYCLEEWDKVEVIQSILGKDSFEDEEDYESPINNGYPRQLSYLYEYLPELDEEGNYCILNEGYRGSILFRGRFMFSAYSIDENFYKYLYKSNENYKEGGIVGGYGYFGSVSGSVFYTNVFKNDWKCM